MSIPGAGNPLLLGGAGGYKIERSTRLNASDSAFFSRTPASAGNRKTWTWAGWVKRSDVGANRNVLFSAGNSDIGGNSIFVLEFFSNYKIRLADGTTQFFLSSAVYRDPGAWCHVVCAVDTTQATTTNRIKVYVNGNQITAGSYSAPAQNYDTQINNTSKHSIGAYSVTNTLLFSGYLADIHFIDGQALTPSSFGEFDTNGVWQPKAYSGSYGTNGFKLAFADNSAATATTLGKDTSGNGNNWTPNNLIAGPATISNSWSGYQSSTTARVYTPSSAAFALGTNDFCYEGWVWSSNYEAVTYPRGFGLGPYYNNPNSFGVSLADSDESRKIAVYWYESGGVLSRKLVASTQKVPTSQWSHIAVVRNGSNFALFLNGERVATYTSSGSIGDGSNTYAFVGGTGFGSEGFVGYASNVRLVKGSSVYDPTQTSITVPTAPLTAITNTQLLTLQDSTIIDNSPNAFSLTADSVTANVNSPFEEFSDTDSLVDSPTNYGTDTGAGGEVVGNYATWNPLIKGGNVTLSNGNLNVVSALSGGRSTISTIAFDVGADNFYCELTVNSSGSTFGIIGIENPDVANYIGYSALGYAYSTNGSKYNSNSGSAYGASYTAGDIIGMAAGSGSVTFYKNGVSQGVAFSGLSGKFYVGVGAINMNNDINFGQRPFAYTAPSGFKALCTTNLPTPTIADGSTVMDVALWTGNSSARSITGLGFSPDFVWIKSRVNSPIDNTPLDHALYDSVRGATLDLVSNSTAAETTQTQGLTAFNSDGFSLGTLTKVNQNTGTYVGWTWDAGSSTVTNTDGTITSQVRANPSAGFSVVTYTGNGTNGATVGHGLGVAPSLVIIKNRTSAGNNWVVLGGLLNSLTSNGVLYLNATNALFSAPVSTAVSSTIFTLTNGSDNNGNTNNMVAYCFAPVAGYSAFGRYTGNGSADGPFVYTGFRPRWLMIKSTAGNSTTDYWFVWDTARATYNPMDAHLYPNSNLAEQAPGTANYDALSNGFKVRSTFAGLNTNAQTYIFAAFAESPFALARAR